jgi:iron complex outermembrane receptor protein
VDAKDYSLRARHEAALGNVKNIFVIGTDYSRWTRDIPAFGATAHRQSRAWYLKDDVVLGGGGTRLSAGLRTERIEKDDAFVSPLSDRQKAWELGVNQPLTPQLTVYGRVGRSFRLASVDEFSFTAPGAILAPQVSRDIELGGRWNYTAGKVELRLYRSNLTNELGFDPNAAGTLYGANINFDPTRRQGLELDTSHDVSKTLTLRIHAALRQSTFRSGPYAGNDVPLAPSRTLALRADWQPAANHRVTGGLNWVSSQHPDFNNQCRMPSYTTADLRYAYAWQNAELSLGVANLFDRQHYTQAFGCVAGVTTAIYPEPGRAITAALRVRF